MRTCLTIGTTLAALSVASTCAYGQHLWWKPTSTDKKFTCLYGEIEVLSTNKFIYYCGCTWWPGAPAGGYTGIQDQGGGRHNVIFSIWDTSPTLHPSIVEQESRTQGSRFGGEGTGAHTHLDYDWKLGKTYRYYVTKVQDATQANTLTKLYFYDDILRRWVHEATISNPNDGHVSVTTFGGGLNGFLENWMGEERSKPKLALYRMWLGTSPRDMENVTNGGGDGKWGVLNDSFYLAEGDDSALEPVFAKALRPHSQLIKAEPGKGILTVKERKLPGRIVRELEKLPSLP
ncbi:MAG: DUF3472 domain-containing protein [Fimbriimonas sp.]|nr:DUF3472 domain-containing protein [Fimbriimonas sp.]